MEYVTITVEDTTGFMRSISFDPTIVGPEETKADRRRDWFSLVAAKFADDYTKSKGI